MGLEEKLTTSALEAAAFSLSPWESGQPSGIHPNRRQGGGTRVSPHQPVTDHKPLPGGRGRHNLRGSSPLWWRAMSRKGPISEVTAVSRSSKTSPEPGRGTTGDATIISTPTQLFSFAFVLHYTFQVSKPKPLAHLLSIFAVPELTKRLHF